MKQFFLLFFLLCTTCFSQSSIVDSKHSELHFYLGAVTGSLSSQINETTKLNIPNYVVHLGSSILVGLSVETYRTIQDDNFSMKNFGFTVAGGLFSFGIDELSKALGINPKYLRVVIIAGGLTGIGLTMNL